MYQGKSILAFIPARGGSKGIPHKNIAHVAGKPLIAYAIEAAQKSGVCDYVLVSTDDREIERVARKVGAQVPFLRPPELATDQSSTGDALRHAMGWMQEQGLYFDWVIILQPTSPLRNETDIAKACSLMRERKAQAIISVCQVEHHPWWCNTLPEDGCLGSFIRSEVVGLGRQQLPPFYRINGAIYLLQWDLARNSDNWYGPNTYAYVMPPERSIDIDTEADLAWVELWLSRAHDP